VIILYETEVCPYCQEAKEFLDEMGVSYNEVDVSKDEKAAKEMVEKSGQMGVPVLDIDGEIVIGFDKEKISELLGK